MASTGLLALGGIGNALSEGVDSYYKAKGFQNDEKNRKIQQGLLAAQNNMQVDPDTGDIGLTPFGQAQQTAKQSEYDNSIAGRDSASPRSVNARTLTRGLLDQAKPGLGAQLVSDDMTEEDLQKNPYISQALHGEYGVKAAKATREAGAGKRENDALHDVTTSLESARGNPVVAQAERDIYAAAKAKKLAGMYGDPNKLSAPQVQLLATEVAKMASGGVPSIHELRGLNPDTIQKTLGSIITKFTNEPTPANAAAFVKQFTDYADGVTEDAEKVIQDKYGRVIESNRDRLGERNYGTLQNNYINRFPKREQKTGLLDTAPAGVLPPEKQKRLEELRAKKAAGSLKK